MKLYLLILKGCRIVETNFCPGCTHGIANVLYGDADEMASLVKTIGAAHRCKCPDLSQFMNFVCGFGPGRAPAVASGISASPRQAGLHVSGGRRPGLFRMVEIVMRRPERKNLHLLLNNCVTGKTPVRCADDAHRQETTTSRKDGQGASGMPIRMAELISTLGLRCLCGRVASIHPLHTAGMKAVRRAFEFRKRSLLRVCGSFCQTARRTGAVAP
jgi:2-oxoglutarate ferredoxin oxidoreductase subunit beta